MSNNIMELDFTGVESYSLIPVGTHNVKVIGAEFKKAQTGSDQLELNFEDNNGSTRKAWFSLLPQALWKVKQVLEAIGISCEGRVKINTKAIIGKTCQITVEDDANDLSRQIVTKVSKLSATAVPQLNFTPAPQGAPSQPEWVSQSQPVQAQPTAPTGNSASPSPMMSSPFNPAPMPAHVTESAQPQQSAPQAPQGNLPPWMKQATGNTAPQGNLPPWMKQ